MTLGVTNGKSPYQSLQKEEQGSDNFESYKYSGLFSLIQQFGEYEIRPPLKYQKDKRLVTFKREMKLSHIQIKNALKTQTMMSKFVHLHGNRT